MHIDVFVGFGDHAGNERQWSIDRLCFERDTEPYARQRDKTIKVPVF